MVSKASEDLRNREAGEYDQPIARQVEIDIFQVMGPGTPDSDILHVTDYYTRRVKCGQGAPTADIGGSASADFGVNLHNHGGQPRYWAARGVYNARHQIVSGGTTWRGA